MRLTPAILTVASFACAALLSFLMALAVGGALESRSQRHVTRALVANGLDWASASADGLLVTLTGTAPTETIRFRATTVAGRVVGASRVIDAMEVTPTKALTAPRFSLELLRNDDGISMIGLVPAAWKTDALLTTARQLAPAESLANMLETADFPVPATWDTAMEFGLVALRLLPRSKISVAADGVQVTAISDSPAQKRRFEADLGRALPQGVPTQITISAPRPVIAPFTLRFVIDDGGPRFDACAADSERSQSRILNAARLAQVPGTPACTLGLGAPSPRWPDAAEAVIAALAELGAGSVTISDVDVTLIADSTVAQTDFDRVIGELTTRLPDVFSLKSTLTPRPQAEGPQGPAQFTATVSPEGAVQLRGRLVDERMRDAVEAFARARFGATNIYTAARLDDSLPNGWGVRVLAGLAALAELHNGALLVEPDRVAVRGVTGNKEARSEISRLLSDRLGQGAGFSVDVTYNEKLDPARALPTPAECLALASAVLDRRQITFAPGKAEIEGESNAIIGELVDALADCTGTPLEIGGHTDSQGRAATNLDLSQQRAEAVLTALDTRGLDTSEMSARGYGAAEPIADNATEEGRVANRRIALKLVSPDDPPDAPALIQIDPEPEDDGEALPPPPDRPDDLVPGEIGEAEGDEPMGDAGDLEMGDDGEFTDPPPEEPAADAAETGVTRPADAGALIRGVLGADGDPELGEWRETAGPTALRPKSRP
ncbi:OmpA family protein [Gemmobacter sp.]|uniref:OmpA family protein n=1 Tax=Gemmobacter sp. TaxID=1898957 RepID=UPI002B0039DB|nr:OmpA family protein [Gemmobacter sp.]